MDSIQNITSKNITPSSVIHPQISTILNSIFHNKSNNINITYNITSTILNSIFGNKIKNLTINLPTRTNLLLFNNTKIQSTNFEKSSIIKVNNNTNINNITYYNETDLSDNLLESNINKTINKKDTTIYNSIIENTFINNSYDLHNQSNIISQVNNTSHNILKLIIGIIFPIIFILFLICLIYCCIKRRKKLSMNNNDLNKIKLKTSGSKVSYKKIQNTSNLNIINPNNMSMSEIKVQNIKNVNLMSRSSGSSSSSRRKRDKNTNTKHNNMMGVEGQKKVQNEIKEQIKQIVINDNINN